VTIYIQALIISSRPIDKLLNILTWSMVTSQGRPFLYHMGMTPIFLPMSPTRVVLVPSWSQVPLGQGLSSSLRGLSSSDSSTSRRVLKNKCHFIILRFLELTLKVIFIWTIIVFIWHKKKNHNYKACIIAL